MGQYQNKETTGAREHGSTGSSDRKGTIVRFDVSNSKNGSRRNTGRSSIKSNKSGSQPFFHPENFSGVVPIVLLCKVE